MALKYAPDQPRVPAGSSDGGQWTSGGGGIAQSADAGGSNIGETTAAPMEFDPSRSGWHDYTSGPNQVCSADLTCSSEEMADHLARFAVPGQDPAQPVSDGNIYFAYDTDTGLPGGYVRTTISQDGLTIVNRTLPGHVFFDGQITRNAVQASDGSWHVTTRGVGNNVVPGMDTINQWQGPRIFDSLDRRLRDNVERHHGVSKAISLECGGDGSGRGHWRGGDIDGGAYHGC